MHLLWFPICLSAFLDFVLTVCLFGCQNGYRFTWLSVYLSSWLYNLIVCPALALSVCLLTCLPAGHAALLVVYISQAFLYVSVCLCMYLSSLLSVYLAIYKGRSISVHVHVCLFFCLPGP